MVTKDQPSSLTDTPSAWRRAWNLCQRVAMAPPSLVVGRGILWGDHFDAGRVKRRTEVLRGYRVGHEPVGPTKLGDLGEQSASELGRVGQNDHLIGARHHLAHHRGLTWVAGCESTVVRHRADGDEGEVAADVDIARRRQRERDRAD